MFGLGWLTIDSNANYGRILTAPYPDVLKVKSEEKTILYMKAFLRSPEKLIFWGAIIVTLEEVRLEIVSQLLDVARINCA